MIAKAIEKLLEMAKPEHIVINGSNYCSKDIYPVKSPLPVSLELHSLTGLVDFIKNSGDVKVEDVLVHIENFDKVFLYSKIFGEFEQRKTYAKVLLEPVDFSFEQYYDSEKFNVAIQACFTEYGTESVYGVAGTDKANVLKFSKNVCSRAEAGIIDDGISQEVTLKTSVVSKENAVLPNPVKLCPYRTFTEIEQPESEFVFRVNNSMNFALFEADGGAWKNEARKRIKEFLTNKIENLVVIA